MNLSKCNGCGISERLWRQLDTHGYCERCVIERARGANMARDVDEPARGRPPVPVRIVNVKRDDYRYQPRDAFGRFGK